MSLDFGLSDAGEILDVESEEKKDEEGHFVTLKDEEGNAMALKNSEKTKFKSLKSSTSFRNRKKSDVDQIPSAGGGPVFPSVSSSASVSSEGTISRFRSGSTSSISGTCRFIS